MPNGDRIDVMDARLLLALIERPRSTTVALADQTGLSRNTVQARLAKLEEGGGLESFERRISPRRLGHPLTVFAAVQVVQRMLDEVAEALADIPEVLQVYSVSGPTDLMVQAVAADADDLYRIAGMMLAIPGVERTTTSLVTREIVAYRTTPLLRRLLQTPTS
ncbi:MULTISPECIES: Lrp/AsnC family transcriptional regulator [Actinomadura]|uniref:AsnC family transcriptional regulator n=1 Tax=Actinomadura litoris TaxID=2678616 RepID=A0A7K1LAZ9_9ACTN|nr:MULTISPECIES: Lrp/AsnC family transcriptional regulator [Actinomadura]MBT2213185.1 Lrp/AsnC family transcriptional regulator [Actinomadura sp. NEAU-AAG7]MUN41600.1 AsnC family transcriptional regulator [Actinomadura litoris]